MELVSGNVVQSCSNAANPFHECTALCLERLNSGDVHKKEKKLFGFGKRTPTRDTPPGSPAPARGSRSPLASYFAKKKVESDHSPPHDYTNGNFFSRLSPLQGRKNEPANNVDSLPMSPSLADNSGGDFFARSTDQRGGDDDDISQSILSESYVSVGDYKVRASFSTTLQLIFDKHGDTAFGSKLQSLMTRSYYLDMLASVVFELQTTPLKHLKETRAVEMLAIVIDVESVKIKTDWLKPILEEIVEAVKHYDEHEMRMMQKEVWERDVLLARQEMEKQLRDKEKKMKEWRETMTGSWGILT